MKLKPSSVEAPSPSGQPVRRRYEKSPLVSAVVEVRYPQIPGGDPNVIAGVYNDLKSIYPEPLIHQVSLDESGTPTITLILCNEDKSSVLEVMPGSMNVQRNGVYPGWGVFKKQVLQSIESVFNRKPGLVMDRVTVKYASRFRVGTLPYDYNTLIEIPQPLPKIIKEGLPLSMDTSGIAYDSEKDAAFRWQFQTKPNLEPVEGEVGLMKATAVDNVLILEVNRTFSNPISDMSEISREVDAIHDLQIELFESLITDKMREIMGPAS